MNIMNNNLLLVNFNNTNSPIDIIIINRISTINQITGDSLETQKYKNIKFCEDKFNIIKIYDIVHTSYKKIPNQYYDIIKNYYNINLIFLNADRFCRNITDGSTFIDYCNKNLITIIFSESNLYSNDIDQKNKMLSAICNAQMESERLSFRLKRRNKMLKEKGTYIPSYIPYGKKIFKEKNTKKIIINNKEKEIIKLIEMLKDNIYTAKQCSNQIQKINPSMDMNKWPLNFYDKENNIILKFNKSNTLNNKEIADILNEYEILKRGKKWTSYKVKSCIPNISNINNLLSQINL